MASGRLSAIWVSEEHEQYIIASLVLPLLKPAHFFTSVGSVCPGASVVTCVMTVSYGFHKWLVAIQIIFLWFEDGEGKHWITIWERCIVSNSDWWGDAIAARLLICYCKNSH